jgi:succinate dehydrogenase / fumarate reductase membrane anchor subunit
MKTHKGTGAFIAQRASAVVLLPLVGWFLYAAVELSAADYAAARAYFSRPLAAVPFALLIIASAYHMRIGLGEVIADYIHDGLKGVLKALNLLVAAAAAAGAAWAAYALAF